MDPIVRLRQVHKAYGALHVLRGIDLDVPPAQTVSIIGPSGSGKSTLLRLLMTLDRPDSGRIEIDGESPWMLSKGGREAPADERHMRRVRGKVGMVFQHFNLFPHMTALGNVMEAPLHVLGLSRDEARARAAEHLAMVGLEDKAGAWPAQLSGGQKQRVGIARALAARPQVLLCDEATSALDPETTQSVLSLLADINRQLGLTIVLITHQLEVVKSLCDHAVLLENGELIESGKIADLLVTPWSRLRQALLPDPQAERLFLQRHGLNGRPLCVA